MVLADQLDDHQLRLRRQLMRLRVLASSRDGSSLSQEAVAEIRDASNVIIAEAEAMSRTAIGAGRREEPQAETLVWVRIARLAAVADRAVDAARSRDMPGLRAHLDQFHTFTFAIWATQHPVYKAWPL
jgi:hypothetical protein